MKIANMDAKAAIDAFYAKDYRRAANLFANMDIRNQNIMSLLTAENRRQVRDILSTAELQKELQANASGKEGFATDQKPAKTTITDMPQPTDGFGSVQAMEKIQYEYMRDQSGKVQKSALEAFKSDPQQAIDMLKEFVEKLDKIRLDPSQQASLRRPVETQINHYRTIQVQIEMEKARRNAPKVGHDEAKAERRHRQDAG